MEMEYLRHTYPAIDVNEEGDLIGIYAGGFNAIRFISLSEEIKPVFGFLFAKKEDNRRMISYQMDNTFRNIITAVIFWVSVREI
jgi:hypothetical protein